MRLCRDCKHLFSDDRCRLSPMPPDLVNGGLQGYYKAQAERETIGGCGERARWFEPKVKEPLV